MTSWHVEFRTPIAVPGRRRPLRTLGEAARFLAQQHKAKPRLFQEPRWKTALATVLVIGRNAPTIVDMAETALRNLSAQKSPPA